MSPKDALDYLSKTQPPPEVQLHRTEEEQLTLFFGREEAKEYSKSAYAYPIIILIGIYLVVMGLLIPYAEQLWVTLLQSGGFVVTGLLLVYWAGRRLKGADGQNKRQRGSKTGNVLELRLHKEGGELYKHIAHQPSRLFHHFAWEEITKVQLVRKKSKKALPPPYFVKISSHMYEDLYLLEWEVLGEEVGYLGNLIRALAGFHKTGKIPEDWNKSIEEQDPPFLDLSNHLIDA
jgi:hypothetical protein